METLHPRISTYNNNPIRSQELDLLSWSQETKSTTSPWSLYLSEFDVKLVHTPRNKMVQSDALSQRPDLCPDDDTDNENMIMLPDNMFLNHIDMDLQQWWMILMAMQPKHWNSFWKQHPHQWQKDWRIGKLKQQMDETFFSSKERTIYQEIWTYDEK